MDEFDKIREFSEDINNRKEPSFLKDDKAESGAIHDEQDDDASLYDFRPEFNERLGVSPDEIEEKNFSSMKLHVIAIVIFVGVLLIVLAGFFFFGDDSAEQQGNDVITITATSDPVKVRPEQPGGMNIPDQDKLVYGRIRSNNVNTKVESLFPEAEQPVMPNTLAIEKNAPTSDFVPMDKAKGYNPLDEAPTPQVAADVAQPDVAPKIEEVPLRKASEMPAPRVQKAAIADDGDAQGWAAQLMSSSNKQTVEKAWPGILSKNKSLLSNMSHNIVKADIPGKGTFYRLKVGNFKTRDMAAALCAKLKANKQDCIPAK